MGANSTEVGKWTGKANSAARFLAPGDLTFSASYGELRRAEIADRKEPYTCKAI